MNPLTDDQVADIKDRINKVAPEVKKLLDEAELVLSAQPHYQGVGNGGFITTLEVGYADTKYLPKPAPSEKKEEPNVLKKED